MADIGNTVFDPWEYTGWIDGSFKGLDISGNGEDTITFWWYGSIEAQPSTLYAAIYEGHSADATNMDLTLCQGSETYSVIDTVPAWHSFTMPSVTLVNGADYYLTVQASAGESLELWNANRFQTHSGYSEWHDTGYPWPDPLIADSPIRNPCIYIETEASGDSGVPISVFINANQMIY